MQKPCQKRYDRKLKKHELCQNVIRESSFTISHSMRCKVPTANELLRFKMEKMLPVVDFISIKNYGG